MTTKTPAYPYSRISTKRQRKGTGIDRQEQTLNAFFATSTDLQRDDSLELVDAGVSSFKGKNAEIGKLAKFLELSKAGTIRTGFLVIENMDRLSRQEPRKVFNLIGQILDTGMGLAVINMGTRYTSQSMTTSPEKWYGLLGEMIRANKESQRKSDLAKTAPPQSIRKNRWHQDLRNVSLLDQ